MRAAILHQVGTAPRVGEFNPPADGDVVDVHIAGCNPIDLTLASGDMGDPMTPSVVGQEGVGTTADGTRVYFNSPPDPFGSWAERCPADPAKTFPVPDGMDDDLAVALGIAGLAAWLPLTHHASVTDGQSVLVLGATGVVGRIAVQAARILGAGRIVAAGRNQQALAAVGELGADATVVLGGGDDRGALQKEAGEGFDVVIDLVYGDPFLAALDATAPRATLITVGLGAGGSADIPFRSLQGRTHIGHGNNVLDPKILRAGYEALSAHAAAGRISVPIKTYPLEQAGQAWSAQSKSPHEKIVLRL